MLNQADKQVLQALVRLDSSEDFKTVGHWLKSELERITEANDHQLDDILLRRGQGAALLLRQYFNIQDNAENDLTKIR